MGMRRVYVTNLSLATVSRNAGTDAGNRLNVDNGQGQWTSVNIVHDVRAINISR